MSELQHAPTLSGLLRIGTCFLSELAALRKAYGAETQA